MTKEKVYIVGHTKPDLDSIASAFAYQVYMNSQGFFNYYAIRCEDVNPLTKWIFEIFETRLPEYIPDVSGMNLVLVDHTYPESRPKGWESSNIIEVIDHHDVKLEDLIPEKILIRECGSTASLIAELIVNSGIDIPKNVAGILVSAIIDDTLNLESPTTTSLDIDMLYTLVDLSGIKDLDQFVEDIFNKKDNWANMIPKDILAMDMKEIDFNGNRVVISQIETRDGSSINIDSLIDEMRNQDISNPIGLRLAMVTDILKSECKLLVVGKDLKLFEDRIGENIVNNILVLSNVVSRKKQILPIIKGMYE